MVVSRAAAGSQLGSIDLKLPFLKGLTHNSYNEAKHQSFTYHNGGSGWDHF